jgi:hypothetical protein
MNALVKSVGLAPFVLFGSLILCFAVPQIVFWVSDRETAIRVSIEMWEGWRFLAVGCIAFILGKIFHD